METIGIIGGFGFRDQGFVARDQGFFGARLLGREVPLAAHLCCLEAPTNHTNFIQEGFKNVSWLHDSPNNTA